jgi:Fic-DOC domain mobile mystery protein B
VSAETLLDDGYLRRLHAQTFGEVWEWAGRYRSRETNIGIDPRQIGVSVRALVKDAETWVDHETYEPDELAVRFHHRVVSIHPFPNGNGRHGPQGSSRRIPSNEPPWGSLRALVASS